MATATFTEQTHSYERDGVAIPSVTQVLTLSGISDVSGVPVHILQRAADIGTAVHKATELLEEGDLDLDSLDPATVGFVRAYQLFREQQQWESEYVERRGVCDGPLPYGFCVDRIGTSKDGRFLLDIKTSSKPQPSWAIQTAAYCSGIGISLPRAVVHLSKDGTYKIISHEDDSDFGVWESALRVAYWRLQHGTKIK